MLAQILWGALEDISARNFAGGTISDIVNAIVLYIFPLAGLLLLLYLLYGGYKLMLSRGDPKSIQGGQKIITGAIVGFVIVFISFWLVQIIAAMFGLEPIINIFG